MDIGPYQALKRYCADCKVKRSNAAPAKKARPPAPHVVRYLTCRVCGVEFPRARLGRDPQRCPEHRFPSEMTRPKRDYPREKNQAWAMVRKFGITLDDRAAMLTAQGGGCLLCGEPETESVRLHVDHDHDCCPSHTHTCGRCIRGLICSTCNAALGLMNDDAHAFAAMLRYLRAGGGAGSPNRKRLRNL